ncbi:MAG: response regulator [Pegethrix bostrychoides GSE-TBD4-15B]|jgi:signal transduction histidine kinase|uniref:histidine kinase n=1 Tax=Pegethrix bostrychoides GSE-TBD4-15B TaxID=2839662 RepID=A0A951PA16_9CYAN|nr:response regulator [Pegethrix bostrychoides GSE-TBD4-15B]
MAVQASILAVDDKPDNLRLLAKILMGEAYKVRKVTTGRQALEAARLNPPDLILLDIMMPELDGYQICQALKQQPETCDIPIIFLSALDNQTDKVRAFTVGGVDYITKPFQQQEVLARVKTHLQIQQLTQSLRLQNSRLQAEVQQRQQTAAELTATLQELRDTQAQIIAKEKLASLGGLMAGIAHELRNPLNFVNNYAESSAELIDDLLSEIRSVSPTDISLAELQAQLTEIRENALSIHQHGQRAERIITSMMQHARNRSDDRQLVDLNQLMEESFKLAYHSRRSNLPNFKVTLETDYDPSMGELELSTDLHRAFINLIDNACYALYKKQQQHSAFVPTLRIATRRLPSQVEIRIRDNGIGIAPEIQAQVFDPFFTTKANEGSGLGLSITHDIVVGQHRGSLSLVSELDDYTEFTLLLPTAFP